MPTRSAWHDAMLKARCTAICRTFTDAGISVRCRAYTTHPSGTCPSHRRNPPRPQKTEPPKGPRTAIARRFTQLAQVTLDHHWPEVTWSVIVAEVRSTLVTWDHGPAIREVCEALLPLLPPRARVDADWARVTWQRPGRRARYNALLLSRHVHPAVLAAAARHLSDHRPHHRPRDLARQIDRLVDQTPNPEDCWPPTELDRQIVADLGWSPTADPCHWLARAITTLRCRRDS